MPKPRNPNRDKAREIWLENSNIKLKKIAQMLGETESTVRKWKSTDDWERLKKERSKKRGAPKGSRNAMGHGAPIGNCNAVKHGCYSGICLDALDPDEQDLLCSLSADEEGLMIDQIAILSIRERRLLLTIKNYETGKDQVLASTTTFTSLSGDKCTNYSTQSARNVILRLEKELTGVQNAKARAIEALQRIRLENERQNGGIGQIENNLLDEIAEKASKEIDINEISELQHKADPDADLVE